MAGVTDTQSLRFGQVTDVINHTMVRDLADDIATQLTAADTQQTAALKRPVVRAYRGASLSIPVTTITLIPWDTETTDTHAMLDIAVQPTRFTAGATAGTGIYLVQVEVQAFTTGWTRGDMIFSKNGVFVAQKTFYAPQDLGWMQASCMINLGTIGDYVTVGLYHEGGATTGTVQMYGRCFKLSN